MLTVLRTEIPLFHSNYHLGFYGIASSSSSVLPHSKITTMPTFFALFLSSSVFSVHFHRLYSSHIFWGIVLCAASVEDRHWFFAESIHPNRFGYCSGTEEKTIHTHTWQFQYTLHTLKRNFSKNISTDFSICFALLIHCFRIHFFFASFNAGKTIHL